MERKLAKSNASAKVFVAPIDRVRVVVGDILDLPADALVTAIPETLRVEHGLNQRLMRAAGEDLDRFMLDHIYRPRSGETFSVPGFALKASHVLFGVLPDWKGDFEKEDKHILSCYRGTVDMAARMGLKRIVFPAFIAGEDGFPTNRAIRLAFQGIMDHLRDPVEEVWIVCDSEAVAEEYRERLHLLQQKKAETAT